MNQKNINVLYIDDEINNLNSFKATFRRNFNITTAESVDEALKILERESIHVILSDQRMPKMTGIEFFESIQLIFPNPIRILITGYTDINAVIDAINRGQDICITCNQDTNRIRKYQLNAFKKFYTSHFGIR